MRKTGLRLLGDVPWGRHVALFYERKEDLLELCVPFLKAGLESTEVCVWVIAEPLTERDAWAALGAAVSPRDLDRYRADRRIEMLQSQTWYFTGDSPDLQKVARGWEAKLADALARGYEGLRVAASTPQLEEKHWAEFFDYEERLNRYLSDKAMLVLCAYPITAPRAADVTRTHQSTIKKRREESEAQ
jgi:DcmR-like sensory protein